MRGYERALVADIDLNGRGLAALGVDARFDALRLFICTVEQRDLRAALRQRSGKFTAEHAARASHDRYLSGQIRFYRKFHHNHPFYQGPAFLY